MRFDPDLPLAADQSARRSCIALTVACSIAGTAFLGTGLYAAASIGMAKSAELTRSHQEAFSAYRTASDEAGR